MMELPKNPPVSYSILIITYIGLSSSVFQQAEGVQYGAAVVEYHYIADVTKAKDVLIDNVKHYVQIIEEYKLKLGSKPGIIVFPECGLTPEYNLTDIMVQVPEPSYDQTDFTGNEIIASLSEVAGKTSLYVVVNLLESNGSKVYNTDVVFRSNGTIAARYRKFNLYGEPVDRTPTAEVVSFQTDWNVIFGIFTCFDILYPHPALDLVNRGVKHFIFLSEWYSELPFLTAVQYQMSWAWANDVTLLASGIGNSSRGSTGSGIYLGKNGPLVYYQTLNTDGSKIISALLDSTDSSKGEEISIENDTNDEDANDYGDLKLKQESLTAYTTQEIEPEGCTTPGNISTLKNGDIINCTARIEQQLCNHGLCCAFNMDAVFSLCKEPCNIRQSNPVLDDFSRSVHKMVVFNGVRSFEVATAGLQTCGVVSCRSGLTSSCGLTPKNLTTNWSYRGSKYKILNRYIQNLIVSGHFQTKESFLSPNILLGHNQKSSSTQFGVLTNNFTMTKDSFGHAMITFDNKNMQPLGTAAIFNRIYTRDGLPVTDGATLPHLQSCLHLFPLLLIIKML